MKPAPPRRVVVVVGASSGIGCATAHRLARRGDALVLASRARSVLDDVAQECAAVAPAGAPPALVVPTDIVERDQVEALLAAAVDRFGRVDAVVVSAAVVAYGRFVDVPADVFNRTVTVDLLGSANVARAALRRFEAAGSGHLVLVGSVLGKMAAPWMTSYVTSKWGLYGLARALRIEARATPGVDVSMVTVGSVDTPVYVQGASYVGRTGRPVPPVLRPEAVARTISRVLDRPRRDANVGWTNPLMGAAFRYLPGPFDVFVGPLMSLFGLARTRVAAHSGNVWEPTPAGEAVHGRWGRQWLRLVPLAGVAGAAAVIVRARR